MRHRPSRSARVGGSDLRTDQKIRVFQVRGEPDAERAFRSYVLANQMISTSSASDWFQAESKAVVRGSQLCLELEQTEMAERIPNSKRCLSLAFTKSGLASLKSLV